MKRTMIAGVTTLALGGCHQGAADTGNSVDAGPFHYDLTQTAPLDVEAHTAAGPLAGVIVSIRTTPADPTVSGELLWMGATGKDGHARTPVRVDRAAGGPIDVTLHKAGYRGPYTDEAFRIEHGAFAPSAKISVPINQVGSVSVALEVGS